MFEVRETWDYKELEALFIENGLEINPGEFPPPELIRCWEAVSTENGERAGAIVFEKRAGEFIVGDIAVDKNYRHRDIGTMLMNRLLQEARGLEAERILLIAKVPDFFKTFGFNIISREEAPKISKCFDCPQFETTCHPEIMKLQL